jgi:hypothetical protein
VTAEVIRSTFARYDPVALGVAIATVASGGLFLATAILLLRGGERVGATLSLLGNYLIGYTVTWPGALIGLVESWLGAFAFGWVLAMLINRVVGWNETGLVRKLEMMRTLE